MKYHIIEPEVAGGLGEHTAIDRSSHPPKISRLHYSFDGWLGDALLESFPAFIVTEVAMGNFGAARLSGVCFDDVEVTTSDQFNELYPGKVLPRFVWMKVYGVAGRDDFALLQDGRLVMSAKSLSVLEPLGIGNALIEPYVA